MPAKYLAGEISTKGGSVFSAIIFPDFVDHQHAAKLFVGGTPESGGFVSFDADGKPYAHGHSVGLQINSNPERDDKLLRRLVAQT